MLPEGQRGIRTLVRLKSIKSRKKVCLPPASRGDESESVAGCARSGGARPVPGLDEQAVKLLGNHPIAFTGNGLQTLPVEDTHPPAVVWNEPGFLKYACRIGDGRAAHGQVASQELVGHRETIGPHSVVGQADQRHIRCSTVCKWLQAALCETCESNPCVNRWTRPGSGPARLISSRKASAFMPQRVAGDLRTVPDPAAIHSREEGGADHALVADGGHFDCQAALHNDKQGIHSGRGK